MRRPRLGGFRNLPPPAGALATAFTSAGFSLLLLALVLALRARRRLTRRPRGRSRAAPPRRARGAPRPLLASPAPYGRAPAGSRGLRESGSRGWATPCPSPFLSATAGGGASAPRPPSGRPQRRILRRRLPLKMAEIQFQETKSIVLSSIARLTILSLKSNCRMTVNQFWCAQHRLS